MAGRGLTDAGAARLGLVVAVVVLGAQAAIGAGWSATHDDPTLLQLTRRCLEREKGFGIEATRSDPIAESARGGTLRAIVEGGLVTLSIANSQAEVGRLVAAYSAGGDLGARLDVHGRYVALWLRAPTRPQRQDTYDCAY
jgi:hypothetical protein